MKAAHPIHRFLPRMARRYPMTPWMRRVLAPAGAVVALPVALSVGGAVLTVQAVQASAMGTVIVLERASDGAQASLELTGRAASATAYGVGTVVACSVIGTGAILSVAGEVLAFVPNALGRALLHNER